MINHYIDLHEYINENIYRLPVKENQIITEAINWGGVIKNTLIGGGIIGLIILLIKILTGNTSGSSSGGGGGSSSSVLKIDTIDYLKSFKYLDNLINEYKKNNNILNKLNKENITKLNEELNELSTNINNLNIEGKING